MRPSTAATLALVLSASTAVQGASPPPEGGSIQALLNRYSARTHKAIPIDAIPKDLKANGTAAVGVVGDTTVLIVPVVPKNETTSVQNPKAATKIVKRTKAKKEDIVERLSFVVDSSSVVEEPSFTVLSPSPSVLAAAQEAIVILSSVPSELAAPVASSTEEAVSSTARAARKPYNPAMAKHGRRNHLLNDNRRRWIWSNSIIQDGDEDVPSESDNVALLTPGSTVDLKTPSATLSPPSYSASRAAKVAVESAHSARSSSKSSASTSLSVSVSAAARKAHSASKSSVSASKSSHTSASRSARSASKSASSAAEEESKAAKSSAATAARGQRTASKSASKSASSSAAEESSSSSSKAAAARTARTSSSSSSSSSERSHRPPRTSTRSTSTTPSAAEYRTPRTPKPTTSAASDDNPVVAQVAALQAQQKVHTTILASRINRAKARQQPTDVLLEEEDEGDVELSYYSAEEDEEEFDFEY